MIGFASRASSPSSFFSVFPKLLYFFVSLLFCQMLLAKPSFRQAPSALGDIGKTPISKAWLLGQFSYSHSTSFVAVKKPHARRPGLYLHHKAYAAFQKMYAAARQDGVELFILSAGRNFHRQKQIWERKWAAQKSSIAHHRAKMILQYSAMPGTSRHHWGTEVDLNALDNRYFAKGPGRKVYLWLRKRAKHFGFCQVYGAGRKKGYKEEKWHWSYMPVAKTLLDSYAKQVAYTDLKGFSGAHLAPKLNIIENYVQNIQKHCK